MSKDSDDELIEVTMPLTDADSMADALYRLSGKEPPKRYISRGDLRFLQRVSRGALILTLAITAWAAPKGGADWREAYKSFVNGTYAAGAVNGANWNPPYPTHTEHSETRK